MKSQFLLIKYGLIKSLSQIMFFLFKLNHIITILGFGGLKGRSEFSQYDERRKGEIKD